MSATPRTDALVDEYRRHDSDSVNPSSPEDAYASAIQLSGDLERELGALSLAAKDVHDYLRENCPDIIDISTSSELAADSLRARLQKLHDLLKYGPSTGESPIGLKETSSGSFGRAHQ